MQTVLIPILNDECLENNEDFNVTLTTTMDCVQLIKDELTITVVSDDSKFSFSVGFIVLENTFFFVTRS